MSRTAILVICGLAFIAVLAGLVVLTVVGKDTSVFIGFASSAAVFLVPNLLNLMKSHDTQADVQQIKVQTNGPLTRMQQQVDQISQTVAELQKGGSNAGSP